MMHDDAKHQAVMGAIKTLHDAMEFGFSRVDGRLGRVETHLDRVETRLTSVEGEIRGMRQRLDRLESRA